MGFWYSTMKFTNDYRLSSRPPPSVDRHFLNWSNGTTIGFTSSNLKLWAVKFPIPQTYILHLGYQGIYLIAHSNGRGTQSSHRHTRSWLSDPRKCHHVGRCVDSVSKAPRCSFLKRAVISVTWHSQMACWHCCILREPHTLETSCNNAINVTLCQGTYNRPCSWYLQSLHVL